MNAKHYISALTVAVLVSLPLRAQEPSEEPAKTPAKEVVKPKPDLNVAEISCPKDLQPGPNNEVRVKVINRAKGSELSGKVKIELVVIQADSADRKSLYGEVDAMTFGQKKEAVFTGVEVKDGEFVRFLAIVDPDKAIDEGNEVNNRKLYKVWLKKETPVATPSPAPSESPTPSASPTPDDSEEE